MEPNVLINDPASVSGLTAGELIGYLEKVEDLLGHRNEPVLIDIPETESDNSTNNEPNQLVILGDTHGDFITAQSGVKEFFLDKKENGSAEINSGRHLLFLGDYIDRAPEHCPNGSVINMIYVLSLKLLYPDRVTLLRGNHESFEFIPAPPFDIKDELYKLYGQQCNNVLDHFKSVFKLLPLMARTSSGLIAAHSGVFRRPMGLSEIQDLDRNSLEALGVLTWSEPREYCRPRAGIVGEMYNFNEHEFNDFMESVSANVLVRGHSPRLAGKTIYGERCLTIFTTHTYINLLGDHCAGVVTAPLDSETVTTSDLSLHLQSRGNWLPVKASPIEKII